MSSLRELPVVFVDCQATGASPAHGAVMELGWAVGDGEVVSQLTAVPEGTELTHWVRRVTGITQKHLRDAPPVERVWRALEALGPAHAVIHFATYEDKFLRDLHERFSADRDFPFELLCTHEIARRRLPDLPRRGLRALAGYFGHNVGNLRRSADHVAATRLVWRSLVDELEAIDVGTLTDLRAWLEETPRGKAKARGWPMPESERAELPDAPGVYRMLRVDGSLLYVGKARSLKKRVRSYFTKSTKRAIPERTLEMLSQARRLDVTRTETPLEAALLEQEEIKARSPRYNVALVADERSVWFASPRLDSIREAPDARHVVGPVGDAQVLAEVPALVAALRGDPSARPTLLSATWGPQGERLRAGIAVFARRHPEVPLTRRGLLWLGRALWPRARDRGGDDAPIDEHWRAETVADVIEDALVRAAHVTRRARWLVVLSEASLAWDEGDRTRLLVFERGTVESRDWLEHGTLPPCPPGYARSKAARRRSFDVTTRDRLRVLTTELRRLVTDGAAPRIRTGPGNLIHGDALGRLLHWV
ncbi:MAG: GIY-YIG nuclease family protein [Myxococcales bacterium]|nr:GIY-YIG nuclease family protein [Myxococcales bacterium]